ncbi:MAG TPA: hypothetical protein VI383_03280, partial [Gemmatimonadales bacterium]|nr:hypothetical protein [Gemmatimonadales bacterium]
RPPRWRPFPGPRPDAGITRRSGSGPVVSWRATLPLKRLDPGVWLVAVVATDRAGKTVRREGVLEVKVP